MTYRQITTLTLHLVETIEEVHDERDDGHDSLPPFPTTVETTGYEIRGPGLAKCAAASRRRRAS